MGHAFSKAKETGKESNATPPFESVLGVSELATIEEARKVYIKLFYENQRNNDKLVEINDAFNLFKNSVNIDLYYLVYTGIYNTGRTQERPAANQFESQRSRKGQNLPPRFSGTSADESRINITGSYDMKIVVDDDSTVTLKYKGFTKSFNFVQFSNDFFEKLANHFQIRAPVKFKDSDFLRFYSFWGRFLADDKALENKVRRIVRIVKENDPRVNSRENKHAVASKVYECSTKVCEKKEKQWKHCCEVCKKGFNSENTLKDHLNSRQHRNKVGVSSNAAREEVGENKDCQSSSQNVKDGRSMDEVPSADSCKGIEEGAGLDGNGSSRAERDSNTWHNADHPIFRTCGVCKEVFKTRPELVLHLRKNH